MKQNSKTAPSHEILRALAIGAAVIVITSSPAGTRRLIKGFKKEWKRRNALLALERLRRRRFVDFVEQRDGTLRITITTLGKQKVRQWDLERHRIQKPKQWDRRWHIVASDISEKRKKGRDALRVMLTRWGFYKLQESIYVHPYPCEDEIDLLRELFFLPDHEVLCFSTDHISREERLKKHFGIS